MTSKLFRTRLTIALGLLLAGIGLLAYWLSAEKQTTLFNPAQREVLNVQEGDFQLSFLLAGRDIKYTKIAGSPIYDRQGRVIGRSSPAEGNAYGTNTDTIFYVNILGEKIYMLAIPRDIYLNEWQTKINAMYNYQGAEGLTHSVAKLLDLPIQNYVIINIDLFKGIVDALGGVEVNVPYPMHHEDHAGQLFIHLEPGEQHLDGEQAANFVRFRSTDLGDYSRIDNIKTLASALLARLKDLNIRAVGALPKLLETYQKEVESNIDLRSLLPLLNKVNQLDIVSATLPTEFIEGSSNLKVNVQASEQVLAQLFGGVARAYTETPQLKIFISNASGIEGLGENLKAKLISFGLEEDLISSKDTSLDPVPSRVLATNRYLEAASFYADLLNIDQQQVTRIEDTRGSDTALEIVLGRDASRFYGLSTTATLNNAVSDAVDNSGITILGQP
ncbi:MAG: LCP family protein [Deinococcales bacterium]